VNKKSLMIMGLMALLLSISNHVFAQDTATVNNQHQIGFNASKFIVLLNEQTNSLDLNYRWNVTKSPTSLRFGISYEQNTAIFTTALMLSFPVQSLIVPIGLLLDMVALSF